MDSVYIVSDCGINWPAAGFIFGVYNTYDSAIQRLEELKRGPNSEWAGTDINDISVREFIMNKNTSG